MFLLKDLFRSGEIRTGLAELGAQGAQLHTHFLTNWQFKPAFSSKKNFENPSKNDLVRDKNVNCAPMFLQRPLALKKLNKSNWGEKLQHI